MGPGKVARKLWKDLTPSSPQSGRFAPPLAMA
jgi:hypothetical protein